MATPSIPYLSTKLQELFGEQADQLGRASGFIKRKIKVTGSNFAQTLVFGWLNNPESTVENLCQTGASVGLEISPQGLSQRMTEDAANFLKLQLEAVVGQTMCANPVAIEVLRRFPQVVIEDSSVVTLPSTLADVWRGCGGSEKASKAAVKMQVRWDMVSGGLDGPYLSGGHVSDKVATLAHSPLPSGSLRITDLGYWKIDVLRKQAQNDLYYLTRLQSQTHVLHDNKWLPLSILLQQKQGDRIDLSVQIGKGNPLSTRLIAIRVPPKVASERRRKLKKNAKRNGKTVSANRLALADWTVLVTNVPAEMLSLDEALVFIQMRWQIELLFKLWKQHGLLDESRSEQPWRVLTEFYAKLIAMIIQHWTLLFGLWSIPNRSLVKASAVVRQHAISLALSLSCPLRLADALSACIRSLASGNRINKSRQTPRLFQLLLAFEESQN